MKLIANTPVGTFKRTTDTAYQYVVVRTSNRAKEALTSFQQTNKLPSLATDKRWLANYKWKPLDHLTIDFKVVLEKKTDSQQYNYIFLNSRRYVRASLYCRFHNSVGVH